MPSGPLGSNIIPALRKLRHEDTNDIEASQAIEQDPKLELKD